MQSPLAEGLFERAIIMSGPGDLPFRVITGGRSLASAEQEGQEVARRWRPIACATPRPAGRKNHQGFGTGPLGAHPGRLGHPRRLASRARGSGDQRHGGAGHWNRLLRHGPSAGCDPEGLPTKECRRSAGLRLQNARSSIQPQRTGGPLRPSVPLCRTAPACRFTNGQQARRA